MTLTELFAAIAAAIRSKDGTTAPIPATTFPERIMAISGSGGGNGGGAIVASVTMEKFEEPSVSAIIESYSGFYSYNGYRLPKIPDSVLASYPYCLMYYNSSNGNMQLLLGKGNWYIAPSTDPKYKNALWCSVNSNLQWYYCNLNTGTEWTFYKTTTGWWGDLVFAWSNHDIPNGSATATDIYFEGTTPYPVS